jgi:hypothetical protein
VTKLRSTALVISPAFFGYEHDIVEELERQGFSTTLLDERPSNTSFLRAVARVRKSLISRRIARYYRAKQTEFAGSQFDLVLVVKAEVVPRWFLQRLREKNPQARFVFYAFDSITNASNCLDVLDCFDVRLSFDPDDVAARPEFSYLPLFYTPEFEPLPGPVAGAARRYSTSFIGTLHSDRYAFVKRMMAAGSGKRTYEFFYVPARWYFALVKYVTRQHRLVPWRDVSFASLRRHEIAEVFRESHAVLDMQRPGQSGLTMRTFEVLASGAILVTTNEAIVRESFFDSTRVLVVADDAADSKLDEIQRLLDVMPPARGRPAGFEMFGIENWVRTVSRESGPPVGSV